MGDKMTVIRKIKTVVDDFIRFSIIYIPGVLGGRIRYWYWKGRFKKCGKNIMIDEGVIIQNPEFISVGDNVWIDEYCILIAGKVSYDGKMVKKKISKYFESLEGELIIGSNVHIAPFCVVQAHGGVFIGDNSGIAAGTKIYSLSHHYCDFNNMNTSKIYKFSPMVPDDEQSFLMSPVVIEDNTAIGLNCIVLLGARIKKNSWVLVGSVVIGEIPENCIASGNPARKIKDRFKG